MGRWKGATMLRLFLTKLVIWLDNLPLGIYSNSKQDSVYGRVYSGNIQVKGANNPVSISWWLDKHNVATHTAGGLSAMKEDILNVL